MRKKIPIAYSKERVVLADVLPYETALIFSNRYYYRYLVKRSRSLKDQKYRAKENKSFETIEWLLFGADVKTKPFCFNINHKIGDFRELKVIHPLNQREIVDFYDKYKTLILYYCSLSPFSIRKPASVATFTFYNDLLHKRNSEGDLANTQIEQDDNEYENLKSFFTYEKYSNIHRFFESYQFHRSEKKYNKLKKVDITRCFDSIYTHSISWALLNKPIVKDNVQQSLKTFPGEFDTLMQKLNDNETNGIVIGPEFSRIFAELILQQIDLQLFLRLKQKDENGKQLIHKVDYEIFRYVDDYFIFYNDELTINQIDQELKLLLGDYKLAVNSQKSIIYEKPIITEITLAKQRISDLFVEHLKLKPREIKGKEEGEIRLQMYFSSNNVITRFKSIVKETGVEYKDIMNYTLAVLDKKVANLVEQYIHDKSAIAIDLVYTDKELEKGFLQILDVAFFLYSVSPRVNSSIKLCLVIDKIVTFLRKNKTNDYIEPISSNAKHNIFKKISDEINLIIKKNRTTKVTQIETLYLLIALGQLGREYRLDSALLASYFNLAEKKSCFTTTNDLNYFSITVLLFYIKNIEGYHPIKQCLKNHILTRFKAATEDVNWRANTEMVLLLLDCISCPFLDSNMSGVIARKIKMAIMQLYKAIIEPIADLDKYVLRIKDGLNSLFKVEGFESIQNSVKQKIANSLKLYVAQLGLKFGKDVYKHEEILVETLLDLHSNLSSYNDKYTYKKKLLSLADVTNKVALIKQERYWFTKWTEFDFRLELQAKRSQEVY